MSTPSWRLPTARLEGACSVRCLRVAARTLAILLLTFCLLIAGLIAAPSIRFLTVVDLLALWWLPFALLLAFGLAILLPARYARRSGDLVLLFDGRHWFSATGAPARIEATYLSAGLLAARVAVGDRQHRLLLARGQVSGESWRRIRLGLGAGKAPANEAQPRWPDGVSTVSPALGSRSG